MSQMSHPVPFRQLRDLLRHATGALLDADVRFALMGSFGVWARGGPQPPMTEDVDVVVKPADLEDATVALRDAGYEIVNTDQGWLVKALHPRTNEVGQRLQVDLIHSPIGLPITDDVLDRATVVYVAAMAIPCLAPIDMMTTKLLVLNPTQLDFTGIIERARFLREQFDWDELERRAAGNDVALGFFDLARRLHIDPRAPGGVFIPGNDAATSVVRHSVEHGTAAEEARRMRTRTHHPRPATPLSS